MKLVKKLKAVIPKRQYYVHALLDLRGIQRKTIGPYRWYWMAYLGARMLLSTYPYGEAVISKDKTPPEVSH